MAYVKEVGNGCFVINVDDEEDIQITDEMLHEADEAFEYDLAISQEEMDVLLDILPEVPVRNDPPSANESSQSD